jgi:hypothetical protein
LNPNRVPEEILEFLEIRIVDGRKHLP